VTEGEPARIREVHIAGNKDFSESTLLSLFDQDSGGWLSWYTKSNQYSRAKLNADLETLRFVLPVARLPRVPHRLDPGRDLARPADLSVTVNISEGEKFVVSGMKLEATTSAATRVQDPGHDQAGRALQRRAGRPDHQGLLRLLRLLRLCLRPRAGHARIDRTTNAWR
jgi:outer membrane protein assembly factor BamA